MRHEFGTPVIRQPKELDYDRYIDHLHVPVLPALVKFAVFGGATMWYHRTVWEASKRNMRACFAYLLFLGVNHITSSNFAFGFTPSGVRYNAKRVNNMFELEHQAKLQDKSVSEIGGPLNFDETRDYLEGHLLAATTQPRFYKYTSTIQHWDNWRK